MKNEKRVGYVARDNILNLLSDQEVASVSTAESALRLGEGEEFIQLEQLDRGVQRADGVTVMMGGVLSKKAVQEKTWSRIIAQLKGSGPAPVAGK